MHLDLLIPFRGNGCKGLHTDIFLKILQNCPDVFFATRRDVKRNYSLRRIHRFHHGNTIIAFKNKFYKSDLTAIHPIVLFYCFQSFSNSYR
jgi:hypothetical protein